MGALSRVLQHAIRLADDPDWVAKAQRIKGRERAVDSDDVDA